MKRILTARHVRFFVIDNIASLAGGIDENAKRDWDPVNTWLIDLRFSGITTMMLHHTNKDGGQRGTSAREDNIDMSIMLKQPANYLPENGADFILSFSKARIAYEDLPALQETRFTLGRGENGRMCWKWASVKAELKDEVLRMIDGGLPYEDIASALSISKGRISQIKADAVKRGIMTPKGKLIDDGI